MRIAFNAGFIDGEKLYYSENYGNAFCELNLISNEVKYISEFPDEDPYKINLHKTCLKYGDFIAFIPDFANHIHIYDLKNKEMRSIRIRRSSDTRFLFCGGLVYLDDLWIFPGNLEQPILRYSINDNKYVEMSSLNELVKDRKAIRNQSFWKICAVDNEVFMALINSSLVVCYDLNTNKSHLFDTKIDKLDSVYKTKRGLVLSTLDAKAFKWEPSSNRTEEYYINKNEMILGAGMIVENNNHTYLVPHYGEGILVETGGNSFVSRTELYIDDPKFNEKYVHYENWINWGERIVLSPSFGDNMIIIDGCKLEVLKNEYILDNCYYDKKTKVIKNVASEHVLQEGKPYTLSDILQIL